MKYHGMVINLSKTKVIVTTSDFECFYIKRSPAIYVGKQIEFTEQEIIRKKSTLTKLMFAAACIAILFVMTSISNLVGITNIRSFLFEPEVFAYVDVDINPSLEIGIDDMGNILSLVPLNEDAKVFIKRLNLSKISISQAVDIIIVEVKKSRVVSEAEKDYVLVSSTLNNKNNKSNKAYQVEKEKLDNLMNSLKDNVKDKEKGKVNVFLVQTNINERKDARNKGISTGRYALYNKYTNLKSGFSIEEAKRISVNELIKDISNYKEKTDILKNTPGPTPSTVNTEDNKHSGFTTPSGKSGLNKIPSNNDVPKENFSKEGNIKLITPSPSPTIRIINSTLVRFESYNYPGQFMRHESFKGRISQDVSPVDDSVFKLVPGLADPNCISFESKNFPGYYLMHEDFIIVLKEYDDSANFRECATFRKVPGLADDNLISFQSFNYPKRYIRHRKFFLQIDEIVSDLEKKDATYTEIKVE